MTKKTLILSFIILLLHISSTCGAKDTFTLRDLRCENLVNPIAIDNTTPHFSWKILYDKGQMQQTYYEIQVASDSIALLKGSADLWNSGKINSSSSVMIPYRGKQLASPSLCYWRVRVWNDKGKKTDWSSVSRFGIGLLNNSIQGSYIGLSAEAGNITTPLLRKKVSIDKVSTSFLHVNSLGYHEVYINGKKVSDDVLSPAVSQLDKRSLIVTYDVTPYLRKGENDILLWLGSGWYKKTTYGTVYDGPLVKAQLDILQNKKWETVLTTDASWGGRQTGYKDTNTWQALRFGGEAVSGKQIPVDLSTSELDSHKWFPVVEIVVPNHIATPEMSEPNKIQQTFVPKEIKAWENDTWLVDMGKALNGWFEIRFPQLKEGQEILLEYTDYIDKEGIFQNQDQSDIYIATGRGNEVFKNKFNHHAFQYVRISNLPSKPKKEDIKAYLIHTDYRTTSSFECSDPDLNAIHNMIQYTMKCLAFGGYMVDCPHLERAGYGGDGNSSTETLQTMYDVSPLYMNWLQAWDDSMREGGSLPHVAPNPGAGGGGPYWCGFIVMAPWQTYLNYNDSRLIERYYPAMKEWLGYVEKYTINGLLTRWPDTKYRDWFLGDWLAPMGVDAGAESSVSLVNNCFVSDCFGKMEKMANLMGKPDDAKDFARRKENLNQLLHKTYYNEETSLYSTGSQLDMSYPMLVGVTPPAIHDKVKDRLIAESDEKYKGHIGVGLVGVPIITKWAIENKAVDYFYNILKKRDYPGYLHMIDNGASTTWEYWSGERSRIHNCYNGVGQWFYQAVGGIRTDEENPGYKHFYIEPQIPTGVTWAKTKIDSPYGVISVNWEKSSADKMTMKVDVPVGCKATVILPQNTGSCDLNGKKATGKSLSVGNGSHDLRLSLLP